MRVLSAVLRPSSQHNALSQAKRNALRAPQQEKAAATFERSKPEDYGAKKLTPAQKQVVELQARIAKVQNDAKMTSDAKAALLKTLNAQLAELQQKMQTEQQADN